jgi:hypothetical protein
MQAKTKRVLLATAAGAVLFNFVHAAAWMIPAHESPVRSLTDDAAVVRALEGSAPEAGTYFVNTNAARTGPEVPGYYGWLTVTRTEQYSLTRPLILLALQTVAAALLLSVLLLRIRGTFRTRALSAFGVGVLTQLCGPYVYWAFGWFSAGYAAVMTLDWLVAFAVTAPVLAKLVPAPDGRVEAAEAPVLARAA